MEGLLVGCGVGGVVWILYSPLERQLSGNLLVWDDL